jgi:drug/metabolite transporter (DMT)-like permease
MKLQTALISAIFGVLVIATITMQIVTSNNQTKIEATLFNILQFIFSIAFGWYVTKITTANEFQQNQKRLLFRHIDV